VSGGYANVRSKCLRMRIRQNSDAHFYLGKSKNKIMHFRVVERTLKPRLECSRGQKLCAFSVRGNLSGILMCDLVAREPFSSLTPHIRLEK
jgi:hypothetical protein